jgi:hypothetical protein
MHPNVLLEARHIDTIIGIDLFQALADTDDDFCPRYWYRYSLPAADERSPAIHHDPTLFN